MTNLEKEIRKLVIMFDFVWYPEKAVRCFDMAKCGHIVVVHLGGERVWTNWPSADTEGDALYRWFKPLSSFNEDVKGFCECLVRLGILKQEDFDKHVLLSREAEVKWRYDEDQKTLNTMAKKYQFKPFKLKLVSKVKK